MASLFAVPERAGRTADSTLAKKLNSQSNTKSPVTVKGGGGLVERINTMRAVVSTNLGKFENDYIVIKDEKTLADYISKSIENGVISIDTETTGLDPLLDIVVGICVYTPDMKAAYIPVNHRSYITNERADGQIDAKYITEQFSRLADTKIIMFNASFDIRMMQNTFGVKLKCYWDCYLGARLLNENEGPGSNNLKKLHNKYVLDGEGDAFRFDDLFKGISFDLVPISTGYLYAAHDAIITYELYKFQEPFLTADNEECIKRGLTDVAWVFRNIEMPCVEVVVDMENTGVDFDTEYAKKLHIEYHNKIDELLADVYKTLDDECGEALEEYKSTHPNHKLSDPINLNSPTQIAVLLYDVMKLPAVDEKSPRATGEAVLSKLNTPFCNKLLEYRGLDKLINTYIDKLPNCVNKKTGRIHCRFNQYGADTGRFSSQDPNLQNIPSHNKDIRKMFKATDGYVLLSSDYSQQEPKCLAALCRANGDSQMYDTFVAGKDLYSEIASKAFNKSYEECCEFAPDGSKNPKEYKERRTQAKSILLGVLYGRGVVSIAEQLGTTTKEASEIKESVFRGFPAIKQFEEASIRMSQEYGFVTTVCGRKRRLPSMMRPDFEVVWQDGVLSDSDPLSFDDDTTTEVPQELQDKWIHRIHRAGFKHKQKVFKEANEDGVRIIDNTRDKDTTKVVNARIQGSAADLTKLAMIKLHNDERLKSLGFRMLIPVHDEIIAECPLENARECAKLLSQTMSLAAEQILEMPIKCDVEVTKCWYGESVEI